jgi:hypothetical protein
MESTKQKRKETDFRAAQLAIRSIHRTPEEFAKDGALFLREIASRKELDTIAEAGQLFRALILEPYAERRKEDGVDQAKA